MKRTLRDATVKIYADGADKAGFAILPEDNGPSASWLLQDPWPVNILAQKPV